MLNEILADSASLKQRSNAMYFDDIWSSLTMNHV